MVVLLRGEWLHTTIVLKSNPNERRSLEKSTTNRANKWKTLYTTKTVLVFWPVFHRKHRRPSDEFRPSAFITGSQAMEGLGPNFDRNRWRDLDVKFGLGNIMVQFFFLGGKISSVFVSLGNKVILCFWWTCLFVGFDLSCPTGNQKQNCRWWFIAIQGWFNPIWIEDYYIDVSQHPPKTLRL